MRKSVTEFNQLLAHYNISKADIARYSGVSAGTIYYWLSGTYNATLKDDTYNKIIAAYQRLKHGKY